MTTLDSDPIRKTYREMVEGFGLEGRTLKTDTWNETETEFPIKADKYIELDAERVRKAQRLGYDVVLGDVRQLPFEDESFDNVVDLSTIDHVVDYQNALAEYKRVLKPGGTLILVCWFDEDREGRIEDWGGFQYWFNEADFRRSFPFKILGETDNLVEDTTSYLKLFYCKK